MIDWYEFTQMVIDASQTGILIWVLVTVLRRRPLTSTATNEPPAATDIDLALRELLEKSRPAGGKLHLHTVEEVIRRRLS